MKVAQCCSVELDSSRTLLAINEADTYTLRLAVDECLVDNDTSRLKLAALHCFVHDGESEVLNVTNDTLHNDYPFEVVWAMPVFVENESPSLILNIYIISNF